MKILIGLFLHPGTSVDGRLDKLIEEIHAVLPGQYVLIISGLPPDILNRVLEHRQGNDPFLRVIHRHGRAGKGAAHWAMMEFAMEKGFDALLTLDEYFQFTGAADIARAAQLLQQNDLILGPRILQSSSLFESLQRGLKSLLRKVSNKLTGFSPLDVSCSFRGYQCSFLQRWRLTSSCLRGPDLDSMFLVHSLFEMLSLSPRIQELSMPTELPMQSGARDILKGDLLADLALLFGLLVQRKKFTHYSRKVIS